MKNLSQEINTDYLENTVALIPRLSSEFFAGPKLIDQVLNDSCLNRNLLRLEFEVKGTKYYAAYFIKFKPTTILRRSVLTYHNHAYVQIDHNNILFLVTDENKEWLDDLVKTIPSTPYNEEEKIKALKSFYGIE